MFYLHFVIPCGIDGPCLRLNVCEIFKSAGTRKIPLWQWVLYTRWHSNIDILLRQGYRYFKLRKAFSKFYRRHSALLEKYSVSLKSFLQQGISEPEFYGDLVYKFRKIIGKSNFSEQFSKLINRHKRIGYSLYIMRQTACLVVNPIIVDGYASLFNCTTAVRASDPMTASS